MNTGQAEGRINMLLTLGIIAVIVGGLIIGLGYPHTVVEEGTFSNDYEASAKDVGSAAAVIVGAFVLGVGQILFFIGAVGKGVQLGVTAAGRAS
jgi:hypothetical protein